MPAVEERLYFWYTSVRVKYMEKEGIHDAVQF